LATRFTFSGFRMRMRYRHCAGVLMAACKTGISYRLDPRSHFGVFPDAPGPIFPSRSAPITESIVG
jgi:hypothetical protein